MILNDVGRTADQFGMKYQHIFRVPWWMNILSIASASASDISIQRGCLPAFSPKPVPAKKSSICDMVLPTPTTQSGKLYTLTMDFFKAIVYYIDNLNT